jgi:hypothetical protein
VGAAMKLVSYGSPEMALLMAASHGDPTREPVRRLMAGPLDWPKLMRLAIDSHALPSLWNVVSTFPDLPPEADILQSLAVINDFRRYHIRSLTARVTRELASEGIEVLALKGAALLAGAVARPTARTMSDIDLLVIRGSAEGAWDICRRNGWTLVDQAWTPELYQEHHHLAPLLDPDGVKVGLELHRTLLTGVDRLGVDVAAIVARSRFVRVGETPIRVLAVEDLLLHTCLHFAWSNKLHRSAWHAFADIHAIVSDPGFDWERFLANATSRRARQCCYWTLRLGRTVADVAVSDEILRRLDPSEGGRYSALLERHFAKQIANVNEDESVALRARRWLWFTAMRESARSTEADQVWNEGAVMVPGEGAGPKQPRGAIRAGLMTCAYFVKLISRG